MQTLSFYGLFLILLCFKSTDACCQNAKSGAKPNIIFILADDMGYGDLSCYGQTKFSTPNIDQLAREGMKFTQAYAGTAVCAPSRSSLFTGLHTGHTFIRGNYSVTEEGQYPIPDSAYIIPEMFKKHGYAAGCFGKWGLGYPGSEGDPVNQGFDQFYGYNCQALAHNYYPYHLWDNRTKVMLPANAGAKQGSYAPALIHSQMLQFIEKNKDRPFIVFMTTVIPHAEVTAPDSVMKKYIGKYGTETPFTGGDTTAPGFVKNGTYTSQAHPHAGYASMINVLDNQVGEIVQKLKELRLDKNTIIIFTSDNGPSIEGGEDPVYFNSSGPFRGHKRDLYEGGIREPFIIKWAGHIKPGTVSDQTIAFWDIFPTFKEIIGDKSPLATDGISFLPTLLNKGKQPQHPYLYWEFHEQGGKTAIRMGKWKAIRLQVGKNRNAPIELYNLEADPREQNNIADKHPEIIKKMQELFRTARTPSPIFNFLPLKKNNKDGGFKK